MVNRRQIREVVMQILYAFDLRKDDIRKVADGLIPEDISNQQKSKDFLLLLIEKIVENLVLIDSKITKHADNWELDRMAVIDKNLMRIAIAEMLFFPDVPPKVSINEAIEIAKRYSTDKSSRFVNGILDATLAELKKSGELQKSGRGLVDMPAKHPKEAHQPQVVIVNEPPPHLKEIQPQQAKRPEPQGGKPPMKTNTTRKSDSRNSDKRKPDNRKRHP